MWNGLYVLQKKTSKKRFGRQNKNKKDENGRKKLHYLSHDNENNLCIYLLGEYCVETNHSKIPNKRDGKMADAKRDAM